MLENSSAISPPRRWFLFVHLRMEASPSSMSAKRKPGFATTTTTATPAGPGVRTSICNAVVSHGTPKIRSDRVNVKIQSGWFDVNLLQMFAISFWSSASRWQLQGFIVGRSSRPGWRLRRFAAANRFAGVRFTPGGASGRCQQG